LTTVAGVTALERAAQRVGIDPADAHVVVIGATGAIGRLSSMMLARRARELTLVGNAGNRQAQQFLSKVADEIVHTLSNERPTARAGGFMAVLRDLLPPQGDEIQKGIAADFKEMCRAQHIACPITATTDLETALQTADLVLVATSADVTILDPTAIPSQSGSIPEPA